MADNKKSKENLKIKIQKELADLIDENTFNDFNQLKQAADKFLKDVQILSNQYQQGLSRTSIKQKITDLYTGMRQDTKYSQEILSYQHEFETRLNEFIGRKIYLTYVTETGHINYYGEANVGKLYQEGTANRGRVNIGESKIFDANDLTENLKMVVNRAEQQRIKVYQEAIRRYTKNDSETKMNYAPSEKTFYWWKKEKETIHEAKNLDGWTDKILNKGIIAEGYAGAVINEDTHVMNNKIELGLKTLWTDHIAKDSIGAAIKGDVVLTSNGHIQFAIKEGSFSTARVGQYVRLAYNILQLQFLDANILQRPEVFKKMVGNSKNLDEFLNAVEEESVQISKEYLVKNTKLKLT